MPLAGHRHVELARQPDAHGPAGLPRAERRDRRKRVGLHLLAAERAAHAEALDGDLVASEPEHARDDVLRFGWMLGGGVQRHAAALVEPRNGAHCVSR